MNLGGIYVEVKGDYSQLNKDLKAAKDLVKQQAGEISNALNNSLSTTQVNKGINSLVGNLSKLSSASKTTGNSFDGINADLKELQKVTGMTATQFGELQSKMLKTQSMKTAENALRSIAKQADLSEKEIKALGKQFNLSSESIDKVTKSTKKASTTLSTLKSTAKALGTAFTVYLGAGALKSLVDIADTYTLLEGRLKLVTSSTEELTHAQEELYKIAQDTRVAYEGTVELYTNLARSTKSLSISQAELLEITSGINEAIIVSGAKAENAANGLLQLNQAMQGGIIRAEEYNSMIENIPRVLEAVAEGLNLKDLGALRSMMLAGELTADKFLEGFKKGMGRVSEQFAQLPTTVEQASTQLSNAFKSLVADTNKSSGATAGLAEAISDLARFIDQNHDSIVGLFTDITKAATASLETVTEFVGGLKAFKALLKGDIALQEYFSLSSDELANYDKAGVAVAKLTETTRELESAQRSLSKMERLSWFYSDEDIEAARENVAELEEQLAYIEQWRDEINAEFNGVSSQGEAETATSEPSTTSSGSTPSSSTATTGTSTASAASTAAALAKIESAQESLNALTLSLMPDGMAKDLAELDSEQQQLLDKVSSLGTTAGWSAEQMATLSATIDDVFSTKREGIEFADTMVDDSFLSELESDVQEATALRAEMSDEVQQLTLSDKQYAIKALDAEMTKRQEMVDAGLLGQEELSAWYKAQMADITESTSDTTEEMTSLWSSATDDMEDYFSDVFVSGLEGDFSDIGSSFDDLLSSMYSSFTAMIGDMLAENLMGVFTGDSSGGGFFSTIGSIFTGSSSSDDGGFLSSIPVVGGVLDWTADLLGFADGGYAATPTVAWVAEKEPEYMVPESKVADFAGWALKAQLGSKLGEWTGFSSWTTGLTDSIGASLGWGGGSDIAFASPQVISQALYGTPATSTIAGTAATSVGSSVNAGTQLAIAEGTYGPAPSVLATMAPMLTALAPVAITLFGEMFGTEYDRYDSEPGAVRNRTGDISADYNRSLTDSFTGMRSSSSDDMYAAYLDQGITRVTYMADELDDATAQMMLGIDGTAASADAAIDVLAGYDVATADSASLLWLAAEAADGTSGAMEALYAQMLDLTGSMEEARTATMGLIASAEAAGDNLDIGSETNADITTSTADYADKSSSVNTDMASESYGQSTELPFWLLEAMLASNYTAGGIVKGYADGGLLQGGSGSKDDLYLGKVNGSAIMAMGGEYIVNPDSTAKYLPELEAINNDTLDTQAFASGGVIGMNLSDYEIPRPPVSNSQTTNNQNSTKQMYVSVPVTITADNPQSFNRSRSQISADLASAVRAGMRNL